MSMFDLSGLFDDPDTLMRNQAAQIAAVNAMQEAIANTVGEASSEDGRVTVTWSEGEGVRDIDLNPRALRLPSDELAALIRTTVNRAREDATAKIGAAVEDTDGIPTATDAQHMIDEMPKVQAFLDDMLRDTSQLGGQIEALVEQMRARAGIDPDEFEDDEDDLTPNREAPSSQDRPSAT